MGVTKSDLFSEEQNSFAQFGKVLSHPARIAILQYLLRSNECINSNLVNELGLAQATVSQHLKELKAVGIIKGTVEGASMNYCIDQEKWFEIKEVFLQFFDQHPSCSSVDCC